MKVPRLLMYFGVTIFVAGLLILLGAAGDSDLGGDNSLFMPRVILGAVLMLTGYGIGRAGQNGMEE